MLVSGGVCCWWWWWWCWLLLAGVVLLWLLECVSVCVCGESAAAD